MGFLCHLERASVLVLLFNIDRLKRFLLVDWCRCFGPGLGRCEEAMRQRGELDSSGLGAVSGHLLADDGPGH